MGVIFEGVEVDSVGGRLMIKLGGGLEEGDHVHVIPDGVVAELSQAEPQLLLDLEVQEDQPDRRLVVEMMVCLVVGCS
jgi:hypothetical protein